MPNYSDPLVMAVAVEKMKTAYPYLVPAENSLTGAAKNVRIELKRAFPGVKFSVRTERFSGGDSMSVRYTDGPVLDEVEAIVNKYKSGSFNGMEDIYEYSDSAFTRVFGDAKYVSASREYSDEAVAAAIEVVMVEYAGNFTKYNIAKPAVEEFRKGKLYNVDVLNCGWNTRYNLQSMIYEALGKTDMTEKVKVAA